SPHSEPEPERFKLPVSSLTDSPCGVFVLKSSSTVNNVSHYVTPPSRASTLGHPHEPGATLGHPSTPGHPSESAVDTAAELVRVARAEAHRLRVRPRPPVWQYEHRLTRALMNVPAVRCDEAPVSP